jgi:hypothetical protein
MTGPDWLIIVVAVTLKFHNLAFAGVYNASLATLKIWGMRRRAEGVDLDNWELRLGELGVSGSVCNLRLSGGERTVSTGGE